MRLYKEKTFTSKSYHIVQLQFQCLDKLHFNILYHFTLTSFTMDRLNLTKDDFIPSKRGKSTILSFLELGYYNIISPIKLG